MRAHRILYGAATLLLVGSQHIAAQTSPDLSPLATGRIIGHVTDAATGDPVEGAAVRLTDFDGFVTLTDSRGNFVLADIPRGVRELVIEHLGYGSGTHLVNVPGGETVVFNAELRTDAIKLDSLVITARVRSTQLERRGFHYRARRGFGYFFSGDDVSTSRLREVLYTVPRLEFVQSPTSRSSRTVMFRLPRGSCVPNIFLDGVRQTWAAGEAELVVAGMETEAIEVYRGLSTPAEFIYGSGMPCGAIVIWTRR